ncbi:MAG: DUF2202 domain-containing protein [Candidatus Magasanikbacteria bacterium]|jgi:hypothetical protein|nr:DUF2202 domain-containing protein [Candidatus Magasanikbacteria bacterium]MBT4071286.1 DUF2202 domain-containing protein [Candidatus Magasanikbacteria bacterium]
MKKNMLISSIILLGIVGVYFFTIGNNTTNRNEIDEYVVDTSDYVLAHPQVSVLPVELLSEEEKNGLIIMREEEKLAHDVYITLYDKWGVNVFRNIAGSEATHTESIRYLIERYNLVDPVSSEDVGVFTNNEFLELYNALVEKGNNSLVDAFMVGATIEDLDIKDLHEFTEQTNNQDILVVYENLIRGSRNHLRAFSKQINNSGETYTAQYLSQKEIDDILSSSQERGGNR